MQPATSAEVADGHPLGIPVLKVADFGFARILPAAAMAETLCGSPLYMAPEILRYEKYDAKADLWSVGAVLFEMVSGRPPFRANNHVELLRKIEKGEDRIKFPDESARSAEKEGVEQEAVVPVSTDIKTLIRALLKRQPANRMSFQDFFGCGVWDGWMVDEAEGMGSTSYEVSTSSSGLEDSGRLREMVKSSEGSHTRVQPTRARQPMSDDQAMNPQPAPQPSAQRRPSVNRSQPKYYVSEESPAAAPPPSASITKATSRPISMQERRMSAREREGSSVEDPVPLTPSTAPGPTIMQPRHRTTEGSPLAATPPLMPSRAKTGKDESALAESDSLNREYVVVEKGAVEVNKLADGTCRLIHKLTSQTSNKHLEYLLVLLDDQVLGPPSLLDLYLHSGQSRVLAPHPRLRPIKHWSSCRTRRPLRYRQPRHSPYHLRLVGHPHRFREHRRYLR